MKNLLTATITSLLVASSMATSRVISFNVYWDTGGANVYGQVTTEHGVSTVSGSRTTGWVNSASGSQNNGGFAAYMGAWTSFSQNISSLGQGNLEFEFTSNAGRESVYIDKVSLTSCC